MENDLSVPDPKDQSGGQSIDILNIMNGAMSVAMPYQKLQFVRTNGHAIKDPHGGFIKNEDGSIKRSKGHRRGVLLAFVDPQDAEKVSIGYSLCHKFDRFDYRMGFHLQGLGSWYALQKAEKHRDSDTFVISTGPQHRQLSKSVVKIPQSIEKVLQSFIYRCSKYYKDKELPKWALDFALSELPELHLIEDEIA